MRNHKTTQDCTRLRLSWREPISKAEPTQRRFCHWLMQSPASGEHSHAAVPPYGIGCTQQPTTRLSAHRAGEEWSGVERSGVEWSERLVCWPPRLSPPQCSPL
eukprot:TRINITY_DN25376_c0_g1_i1.p1 TRINITY_DN25376_c0_g1~~TRINITY_DN25376_c0_g1_i1.p1  ORF type:complete len:103 (+),score=13.74 TRINITY_DN25376_c0_g1_i1:163-471(+)